MDSRYGEWEKCIRQSLERNDGANLSRNPKIIFGSGHFSTCFIISEEGCRATCKQEQKNANRAERSGAADAAKSYLKIVEGNEAQMRQKETRCLELLAQRWRLALFGVSLHAGHVVVRGQFLWYAGIDEFTQHLQVWHGFVVNRRVGVQTRDRFITGKIQSIQVWFQRVLVNVIVMGLDVAPCSQDHMQECDSS